MRGKAGKGALLTLAVLGALLILASAGLLMWSMRAEQTAAAQLPVLSRRIAAAVPRRSEATLSDCPSGAMPALELDGTDYIALLELPGLTAELPICAKWDGKTARSMPCRFSGSAYDRNLVIGGTDAEGQFDFITVVNLSDAVYLTDMAGQVYTYRVTDIKRSNSAEEQVLLGTGCDLTLFARRAIASEYILICCMAEA